MTTTTFRAHFDGKVIVPDQVVDLPVNEPIELQIRVVENEASIVSQSVIQERLARLAKATGIINVQVPNSSYSREEIYDDDGR